MHACGTLTRPSSFAPPPACCLIEDGTVNSPQAVTVLYSQHEDSRRDTDLLQTHRRHALEQAFWLGKRSLQWEFWFCDASACQLGSILTSTTFSILGPNGFSPRATRFDKERYPSLGPCFVFANHVKHPLRLQTHYVIRNEENPPDVSI